MITIWKQRLGIADYDRYPIDGQVGRILHVGLDPEGHPAMWFTVDPHGPPSRFLVWLLGTGGPAVTTPYVGSFVQGPFVWHVFAEVTA